MRTFASALPVTIIVFALAIFHSAGALADSASPNAPNPAAIARVKSGEIVEANAAWWGFNAEDSTECLQAAIDSGAKKLVIPFMDREWIARPLKLRSNIEIVFEPGVIVLAKKGEFTAGGDSLFSATDAADITLYGKGATLRMRKRDYQKPPYSKAEWRSTLDFTGCKRVRVEGLRLESSGGDGIYLGSTSAHPYCEEVIIHDVICRDHHRQGISVISAVNLLIEDCVLSDTDGTAPEAGIDLEPNSSNEKFVNVVVRNCRMENNSGAGILLYPVNLNEESEPLSIRFERCTIKGGKDAGIGIGGLKDNGPKGTVEFIECSVEDTDKCGAYIYDKSPDAALVRFVKCTWKNVARKDPKSEFRVPLMLHAFRKKYAQTQGGVEFSDCFVFDNHTRPVFSVKSDKGARKVNGTIRVENPKGVRAELPAVMTESSMKVIDVHERH